MLTLPTDRCFVVAEAGTNHASPQPDDRFKNAMTYVLRAKEAKADSIKFQWFDLESSEALFCPLDGDHWRWPRWRDSAMHKDDWTQVKRFAEACGLVFLASTFQHSTVAWLNELGVVATKVASRAAATFPYESAPPPYLISTGLGGAPMPFRTWDETQQVPPKGAPPFILFECESKYPSIKRWFWPSDCGTAPMQGFSDHSGTPWRAIDAISRGCRIVEVHYHLDERDAGPDLAASLSLDELKMVCEARDAFSELRKGS